MKKNQIGGFPVAENKNNVLRFNIQRKIVANMTTESWRHIPHVSYIYEADVTDFLDAYKQYDEATPFHLTFNTAMLKALAEGSQADLIVCNDMLTPIQLANLRAKTEREAVTELIRMAKENGFSAWKLGDPVKAGCAYYFNNRGKNLFLFRIGAKDIAKDGVSSSTWP